MRPTRPTLYLVMAVWLIVAAVIRVSLQLTNGTGLDVLPFLSFGLGLVSLATYVRTPRQDPT